MTITQNHSLLPYNTFGIDINSKFFTSVESIEDLLDLLQTSEFMSNKRMTLGGGSNILFTEDYNGLIIKNNIKGIDIVSEDEESVVIRVGAGEVWHSFVMYCIDNELGGLENLSLIPGNVGASPMQNIGAYGVEVKDSVVAVNFIDLESGSVEMLRNDECQFGYRSSIFKTKLSGKVFISSVDFRLHKKPTFNTSYGAIEQELENMNADVNLRNVSQAVINIRQSKLPDPKKIGNAGSFFKNPFIETDRAEELKNNHEGIPLYKVDNGYKVAAGWLIEKSGWKGKNFGSFGVHDKQALVLVNYGGSKGKDIKNLSIEIRQSVKEKFGIDLIPEVNIV